MGIDPWKDRSDALGQTRLRAAVAVALRRRCRSRTTSTSPVQLRPGFDRDYARNRLAQLDIPAGQGARELSGGQQAQVALALALGTRAPILLLDEPLASLDPLARREFLHVLTDAVRSDGATALLSSHIVTDVEQACDRLIVLGVGQRAAPRHGGYGRRAHAISSTERPDAVASFGAPDGSRIWLVRGTATGRRPSTRSCSDTSPPHARSAAAA